MKNNKHHYDFLPAVLEVQETPPSPLGRIILWVVILLLISSIIWASSSKVDIVAITRGKIVVSQLSRPVNTSVTAEITNVFVTEGERVEKGQILITLNSGALEAQIEENLLRQRINRLHIKRLEILRDKYSGINEEIFFPKDLLDDTLSQSILMQLYSEIAADRDTKMVYQHNKNILQSQIEHYQAQQNMARELLPIYKTQYDAIVALYKKDMVSKDDYLELQKKFLEASYSVNFAEVKVKEALANQEQVNVEQQAYITTSIKQAEQERIEKLNENALLVTQYKQLIAILKQYTIIAPVTGKVESLVYRAQGAAVEAPQELLKVVPEGEKMSAEVWVSNQDVGFLKIGQTVTVKIDTFDFTRYGWVDGILTYISADAIEDKDMGLVYKAVITLQNDQLLIDHVVHSLEPGMAVSAEIKTGQRTVLSYLISPMMEALDDVGKQR